MPNLTGMLENVGISAEALDRIHLAQGVVGKSSYVAGTALLALTVVAYNLRESGYLLCIGLVIAFVFVLYFCGVIFFAHSHPGEALLEGAELIKWRQMDMAAKDVSTETIEQQSTPVIAGPSSE